MSVGQMPVGQMPVGQMLAKQNVSLPNVFRPSNEEPFYFMTVVERARLKWYCHGFKQILEKKIS
jgi:hypothetical protein